MHIIATAVYGLLEVHGKHFLAAMAGLGVEQQCLYMGGIGLQSRLKLLGR